MQNVDPVTNDLLLKEAYELAFGIQVPHSEIPIGSVMKSPATDAYLDSDLERTMRWLIKIKAPESTGMGLMELLNLPTYKLKMIVRSLETIAREAPNLNLNKLTHDMKNFK